MPDAYEATLPEVFPDFAPGNFTWDDDLPGWVWTTFNLPVGRQLGQPRRCCASTRRSSSFLANRGVDVLRLDAIAFLWKRLGTNCQGEPEVHALTQVLAGRDPDRRPAVAFKAEAIVAPTKLLPYLGTGAYSGKVSDLAYHNSAHGAVWSMLASQDVRLGGERARLAAAQAHDGARG
jgi:amylosucrase